MYIISCRNPKDILGFLKETVVATSKGENGTAEK